MNPVDTVVFHRTVQMFFALGAVPVCQNGLIARSICQEKRLIIANTNRIYEMKFDFTEENQESRLYECFVENPLVENARFVQQTNVDVCSISVISVVP